MDKKIGGSFGFLQHRKEWDDAIEIIKTNVDHYSNEFEPETVQQLKAGVYYIEQARIYLHRIDLLLIGYYGEELFNNIIKDDIEKLDKLQLL